MFQLPVRFDAAANVVSGISTRWEILSGDNFTTASIPPEFGGPGGGFSPEDLFAQSLTNCFVGTFKVLAENSKLGFDQLRVLGNLTVDNDETGRPIMKHFSLAIALTNPSDADRATRLVQKAIASGFILNSVKTTIDYALEIH